MLNYARTYNSNGYMPRRFVVGQELRLNRPLTMEEIKAVCPAAFATNAHESRSVRYTYIPSMEIIKALIKEGFQPFSAWQSRSRIEGKTEFTKHMIRFRRAGQQMINVGDTCDEIIYINSHDGTSSYIVEAGIFRKVCSNGMVVGDTTLQSIKTHHKGNITHNVIESAYDMAKNFEKVKWEMEKLKAIDLEPNEQEIFANSALLVKYDEEEKPITPNQLLTVRRFEDKPKTLWNTFNVVQENLIKGGLRARTKNNKNTTTRAVNSIDNNVKYNKALWNLTQEMAKLKA